MQTSLDCITCFVRQSLEAARFVTQDTAIHERVMRETLQTAADLDFRLPPPLQAQRVHRRLRELVGDKDPYRDAKQRFNRLAWELLPELSAQVAAAADPFSLAVRLAIAGNIIDLALNGSLDEAEVRRAVARALAEPFSGNIDAFRAEVANARSILYLADNAGEIVFDRLLIERLPRERVIVAVRGSAIINDATLEDAREARIDELVKVIPNGADLPGTALDQCTGEFRRLFETADLIVSKGQGNFETLSNRPENIWFLFKVKCPVVARETGLTLGTHVLTRRA